MSCIVEGHGEVLALPILLRRISVWRNEDSYVDIPQPIRVSRDRFLNRRDEFERHLRLAGSKCGVDGWVLVLLDADDACPAMLGPEILARARVVLPHHAVSVVLVNREFEAWYIGAAQSLNGTRGLFVGAGDLTLDPEVPRDAKGWLSSRMSGRSYGETTDQPAFAAKMDLQQALDRCRSFQKLCKEWDQQNGIVRAK
ncbi:DUF4276 family protein [Lysobacter sp. TAF61]|uniref:DUF4276 family protein n=1 Tax=Lysobacter sp. TAF61 TaxID=3233072 RepID=UPI003F9A69F6